MDETKTTDETPQATRNPIVLLLGFAVLGVAAGLILFGGPLFGSQDVGDVTNPSLLDQLSELEVSTPAISQIPSGSLGAFAVGDIPTDFVLEDTAGNVVRLSDFRGRPVVINFWATWCAPCRVEMPELQAAYEAHQDDGLVLLAINRDESREQVVEFIDELGLTFTPLLDLGAVVSDEYQIQNMPTTYFLNEAGEVTAVHLGALIDIQLDEYLALTINGS
ncbi:MAG: TlpA family protein disulfide reductase [Ardenticatenales bacterium]|nr:TlpA family protein disulfide reductase [Ardenticatenales bacterium]